jgi:hypothetical protein
MAVRRETAAPRVTSGAARRAASWTSSSSRRRMVTSSSRVPAVAAGMVAGRSATAAETGNRMVASLRATGT